MHSRYRKILLKSYSREQGWQHTWRGRKSREKFFLVLKKWKIFLGHDVLQNMLNGQSSETQKQTVEFCSPELARWMISLPFSVFLNFCYHLLLQVSLFLLLFSFPVSCNLTSMLQFIPLSFISPSGPLPVFPGVQPPPPVWVTHSVSILAHTPMPTHFLPSMASIVPLLASFFASTDSVGLPLQFVLMSARISVILI